MWIRFASLVLVVLMTACASNKPVLTDSALEGGEGSDVVAPLPDGLADAYSDGLSLMEDERFEEALEHWQRVSAQYPGFPGIWTNMGLTQWQLSQPEEALQSYERAVSLDAEYCPPYGLSGIVLRDLGRFDEAETAYLSAVDCAPQNAMNYYNLGILKDLYRNDLVAALDWYRKARRLMPDDEKLNIWVIDLARRSGEPEEDPESIDIWQAELEALIRQREAEAAAARAAKQAAQTDNAPSDEQTSTEEAVATDAAQENATQEDIAQSGDAAGNVEQADAESDATGAQVEVVGDVDAEVKAEAEVEGAAAVEESSEIDETLEEGAD